MTMTPSPASQSTFNSTPNSFTGMPAPKPATNLMPSLKPMGGQNSAIPGSGAVDFASGPAHSGGTADPDGINHAMQQNIQHVQPQPVGNMNTGMMSPVPGGQMPGQQPPPVPKMAFIDGFIWQCKKAGLSNQEIIKRATEISLSNSRIALELRALTKAALQDVGWGSMLGNIGSGLKNMGSNLMHPGEWKNTLMGQGTAGENLYGDVSKYPMKTVAPAVAGGLAGGALAAGTGAAGAIAGGVGTVAGGIGKLEGMMPDYASRIARSVGGMGVGSMVSRPFGSAVEGASNAMGVNPDTSHRIGGAARQVLPWVAAPVAAGIPGMAAAGTIPAAAGMYGLVAKPDNEEIMTAPHPRSYLSPDQLAKVDAPQGGGAGPGQPPAPPQGQTPVTGENLFGSPGAQPASPQGQPQGQQGPMGDMAGLGPGAAVQQSAGPPQPQGDELSAWDGGPATPGKAPISGQDVAGAVPGMSGLQQLGAGASSIGNQATHAFSSIATSMGPLAPLAGPAKSLYDIAQANGIHPLEALKTGEGQKMMGHTMETLKQLGASAHDAVAKAEIESRLSPILGKGIAGMVSNFAMLPQPVQMLLAGLLTAGIGYLVGGGMGAMVGGGLGAGLMALAPEISKTLGLDTQSGMKARYGVQTQGQPTDMMPAGLMSTPGAQPPAPTTPPAGNRQLGI